MIEMDLLEPGGRLYANADTRAFAYMIFPHDDAARIDFISAGRQFTLQEEGMPVPARIAKHNFEAGGYPALCERVEPRVSAGDTCGGILIMLRRCAVHAPEHATLSRAQWFASLNMVNRTAGGVSRSKVRKAWSDFKSVAHLWAAVHILDDAPTPSNLANFLGVADCFAQFGMRHAANVAKAPTVLDPDWLIVPPPGISIDVQLPAPEALTDEEKTFLASYSKGSWAT